MIFWGLTHGVWALIVGNTLLSVSRIPQLVAKRTWVCLHYMAAADLVQHTQAWAAGLLNCSVDIRHFCNPAVRARWPGLWNSALWVFYHSVDVSPVTSPRATKAQCLWLKHVAFALAFFLPAFPDFLNSLYITPGSDPYHWLSSVLGYVFSAQKVCVYVKKAISM